MHLSPTSKLGYLSLKHVHEFLDIEPNRSKMTLFAIAGN